MLLSRLRINCCGLADLVSPDPYDVAAQQVLLYCFPSFDAHTERFVPARGYVRLWTGHHRAVYPRDDLGLELR